jgi:NAD(P)-dependent dehydrogenase (short-subunit alcohol dehydrogenase family)
MYISSSAAHRIGGGRSVYGSTKRAGEMFVETLAEEHRDDPLVQVVVVDPGIMDTEMQVVVRTHAREDAYFPDRERFLERYARGEVPSPVDVARRILAERLGPVEVLDSNHVR